MVWKCFNIAERRKNRSKNKFKVENITFFIQ